MKNVINFPKKATANSKKSDSTSNRPDLDRIKPFADIRSINPTIEHFLAFHQSLTVKDSKLAAYHLSGIIGLSENKCITYSLHFQEKMRQNKNFVDKFYLLRQAILEKEANDALMLLHLCFGVQGPEAVIAYNNLSASL